jgi:hypothetical protein
MQRLRSLLPSRYVILGIWLISILVIYWLLPEGTLYVGNSAPEQNISYPNIEIDPPNPQPGQAATVIVHDNVAWPYIATTVTGSHTEFLRSSFDERRRIWVWRWSFITPAQPGYEVGFYHDCDTGCIQRIHTQIGKSDTASPSLLLTKLGVVFADPERDWHGWSGWDVELTYALKVNSYWGIDALAERVQRVSARGLRVLVRVDYAPNQTLPPADDYTALTTYLDYLRRLARDDRFKEVYGYVIGSGFNAQGSNGQSPDHLITPEWYARVFNGYGEDPRRSDNVVETIRPENPAVRVLVGPVRPWVFDQNGQKTYTIDVPWLNYMNTLVAAINDAAEENTKLGIARSGPDGFALHVPGRPDAAEFGGQLHADEPRRDLARPDWNGAQAGFQVYRDWLNIINAYPHTRGLPALITSTNTSTPDQNVPPADNYPRGWLTSALEVVNREPQIQALCWFIDRYDFDDKWAKFQLTEPTGLTQNAADEFDQLLQLKP